MDPSLTMKFTYVSYAPYIHLIPEGNFYNIFIFCDLLTCVQAATCYMRVGMGFFTCQCSKDFRSWNILDFFFLIRDTQLVYCKNNSNYSIILNFTMIVTLPYFL
jgi:hypothetical protein